MTIAPQVATPTTCITSTTAPTGSPHEPGHGHESGSGPRRPRRMSPFLRHYVEMVVAMFVGMAVFGAATQGVAALLGFELALSPAWTSLEMAVDMSLGMALWMRYRGHSWAHTGEMVAVMFVVPGALIPLVWAGVLTGDSLLMVEHVAMLPLMFLVMLRHRHPVPRSETVF